MSILSVARLAHGHTRHRNYHYVFIKIGITIPFLVIRMYFTLLKIVTCHSIVAGYTASSLDKCFHLTFTWITGSVWHIPEATANFMKCWNNKTGHLMSHWNWWTNENTSFIEKQIFILALPYSGKWYLERDQLPKICFCSSVNGTVN